MGVRRTGSSCEGKKPPHTRWSFQQVVRPSGNAPHPLYRPKPIRAPKKKSAKGSPQCSQAMDATSTTPGGTVRPMPGRAGRSSPCILAGLNLEHFAFGEGLGAELAPGGPHPDVLNHAWRDYGNRVGACWRLLARDGAVEQRHVENAPALVFACRGRTNSERQSELPDCRKQRRHQQA